MFRQTPSRIAVAVGCKFGLLLGGVHIINHTLEVFADLQPPLPAIRGVAMWAVMFLVCGAASSIAYGRTRSVLFGIVASIIAAVCGAAILLSGPVTMKINGWPGSMSSQTNSRTCSNWLRL